MQNKYYTVSAIVNSFLADKQESEHLYHLYLHWALEGLREMHFDFAREVKTIELQVNGYKAIDLPSDFIDFVKVACRVGERVFIMGTANDLARSGNTDQCGSRVSHTPQEGNTAPNGTNAGYYLHNFNGGSLFAFNEGLPYNGFFKVLKEVGQIQFDQSIPVDSEIYLEYISDGFNPNGASYVNPYAYKYLKAYIDSQRVSNDDNASQALKEEKGATLFYARKQAKLRIGSFSVQDIINSSRSGYKLTSKI